MKVLDRSQIQMLGQDHFLIVDIFLPGNKIKNILLTINPENGC